MRQYFLLIFVLLLSCNSAKQIARKEQKKLEKAKAVFANHPLDFAADCGRQFPPKTKDSSTLVLKPGATTLVPVETDVDITGFVTAAVMAATEEQRDHLIDSFRKHPLVIKVKGQDQKITAPDTILDTHYVTVENTATLEALNSQLKLLYDTVATSKQKIAYVTDEKKLWRGRAIKGWAAFVGLFIVILIAFILKVTGKLKFL